ncbi:MAG: restriction endonuclease subunit S [Thermoanaerobaculia bacterium]
MSRVDDLIAEHCAAGVEFKALGDIGELIRGRRFTKDDVVPVGLNSIHYGEIYTRYGTSTTTAFSQVRADLAPQLRFARPGDVVIAAVGETVEDVGKAVAWLGDGDVAVHDDCFILRHSLNPKFVSYLLQTSTLNAQKTKYVARAKVKRLSGESLSKLRIPVPPVQIQREIVRTLDTFTQLRAELHAELEAELQLRQRQYEYYRDQVLTFSEREGVRWVSFGAVATIVRGGSPRPIQAYLTDSDDGVNWIKIGDVPPNGKYITGTAERIRADGVSKSRRVAPGDFVLSNSMSFGRPYIVQIDGCIHDGWLAIKDFGESFNPDFLYHLLRSEPLHRQMAQKASNGTVQNLNADIVKSLQLPVPEPSEQTRIVRILDKFDAVANELAIGLSAELNARRKQYGYYRDRLLTFEEASA